MTRLSGRWLLLFVDAQFVAGVLLFWIVALYCYRSSRTMSVWRFEVSVYSCVDDQEDCWAHL